MIQEKKKKSFKLCKWIETRYTPLLKYYKKTEKNELFYLCGYF